MKRRKFISICLWSSIGFGPNPLYASDMWDNYEIDPSYIWKAEKSSDVIKLLYGNRKIIQSDKVEIRAPKLAENGGSIPIRITSDIEAKRVIVFQDANPTSLTGIFEVPKDALVYYDMRIKMRQTAYVTVLIEDVNGIIYANKKEIDVATGGGCGG